MKRYKSVIVFIVLFVTNGFCQNINKNEVLPTSYWDCAKQTVRCTLVTKDSAEFKIKNLNFINENGNKIYTYLTIDNLYGILPLGDATNNLLTVWVTGSAMRIIVFSLANNNIKIVLDANTREFPELVYNDKSRNYLNINLPVSEKNKNRRLHKDFNVYNWNGKEYIKK
jgi:hypothetical protein